MIFYEELTLLKEKIANAEDVDELNYIRTTNQKKILVDQHIYCRFILWFERKSGKNDYNMVC